MSPQPLPMVDGRKAAKSTANGRDPGPEATPVEATFATAVNLRGMAMDVTTATRHDDDGTPRADHARAPSTASPLLPTKIRVVVRVRPLLPSEAMHKSTVLQIHPTKTGISCSSSVGAKNFHFDHVFDASTTQRDFYDDLKVDGMLNAVLDGYHSTIFAYGQTGSGKTFTMEGYDYEKPREFAFGDMPQARFDTSRNLTDRTGLIPRIIFRLFHRMAEQTRKESREFTVRCSYLQIYNEQILDLFNPSHFLQNRSKVVNKLPTKGTSPGLRLRWSALRDFYVENLRVMECTTPEQVLRHFQEGVKHKIMASHNLNAASSRSHCVFTLYVDSVDPTNPSEVLQSKLALVDLAGSERVDKTGATGVTLQESIGINKSLFVLRQVIQGLSDHAQVGHGNQETTSTERSHIPYRDSKLTSLLKYSLGGNSWTLMVACLSPSDAYMEENISTLVYASKTQSISNTPTKNEDPKTQQIQELKREVESLRRQLAQAQDVIIQFQTQPRPPTDTDEAAVSTQSNNTTTKDLPIIPQQEQQSVATLPQQIVSKERETNLAARLKMHVIDNVEMIKQLYATEKHLTGRVTLQEGQIANLRHESHVLQMENQSLREKVEVLEYLVASSGQSNQDQNTKIENDDDPAIQEIPGYGSLSTSSSDTKLMLQPPGPDRLHRVLDRTRPTLEKDPLHPPSLHLMVDVESRSQRESKPKTTKLTNPSQPQQKSDKEITGLLSFAELRDLLGRKMPPANETQPSRPRQDPSSHGSRQRSRGPVSQRPRTNPTPPPELKPPGDNMSSTPDPTTSILSTLQQQKLSTGQSTLEKDPLDSLSELNRLLRVKATLRRSTSFK